MKDLTSWHATELTVRWLLVIPHPVCYEWSFTFLLVQGKAAEVWSHWSWSFCCGPQGEVLGLLDTLFWYTSMRAQQQMLHLPSMVRPPYQEGPGHTFATGIHPSCIHASWSSLRRYSQRGSLQTLCPLYELKLWPGLTILPLLMTCVMLMMYRMSNMSFCTHSHVVSLLRKDLCFPISFRRLKQCVCFSGPGKQLAIFLPALILLHWYFFYEQASSRTTWLKAFFLVTLFRPKLQCFFNLSYNAV